MNTNDNCLLCVGKNLPANRDAVTCVRCSDWYHKACFKKKYNGESAVPGSDFVCVSCSASDGHTSNEKTNNKRRNETSEEETPNKRSRSNSRGRTAKNKNEDIMQFLSEFRAELIKNMEESASRIQQSVNDKIDAFRAELSEVKKENADIVKSIEFVSEKYEEISNTVEQIAKDGTSTKTQVDRMDTVMSASSARLDRIEAALNQQTQMAQKNNLVITGLAKTDNPADSFWKLVSHIKADIGKEEVANVELLKKHNSTEENRGSATRKGAFVSDTLLVRFKSNEAKGKIIKAKKELGATFVDQIQGLVAPSTNNTPGTKPRVIFFRDHLTDYSMKLFEAAKAKQMELKYRFLWTKNGQILLRQSEHTPVHRINSMSDLNKLTQLKS